MRVPQNSSSRPDDPRKKRRRTEAVQGRREEEAVCCLLENRPGGPADLRGMRQSWVRNRLQATPEAAGRERQKYGLSL